MSQATRKELADNIRPRYHKARWKDKGQILDEFVAATGYSRKYAVTLLRDAPKNGQAKVPCRQPRRYDEPVRQALLTVWEAANGICSKRLVPFLPEFVAALERFGHLSLPEDVKQKLLSLSAATVDRLLFPERHRQGKGVSTTKPGKLLKRQIAVRTFADWSDTRAGFFEADLVAHCADRAEGAYLNTLVLTDVATGWTECLALLHRSEADVIGALEALRQQLPFPLLGLDTDNGSEFINYELLRYCQREKITFTRSRAYKKNDQAHVEEKNGSIVRRLIGYDRYEGVQAWRALSALYAVLRRYINFFQPSMKLASKQREGGRVTKHYDAAQTPYQRLLAAETVEDAVKAGLSQSYEGLDPVSLLCQVQRLQEQFWRHAWREAAATWAEAEDTSLPETGPAPQCYRRTKKEAAPHTWRTREDPFEGVWNEVRLRLEIDPSQTTKQLFQSLQQQYPDRFPDGQLRTLQRRVRDWRREQLYLTAARPGSHGSPGGAELTLACGGDATVAGASGTIPCEATVIQ